MEDEEEVTIKVEDEMGIFVKEEESFVGVASSSAYDEDSSTFLADLLVEPSPHFLGAEFQRELMVYTKKLDDMSVWKNLHKFEYPKEILNKVIAESKPAFLGAYKTKKKRKYILKFTKFLSNLQVYNDKVTDENRSSPVEVNNEKQNHVIQTINIDDDDSDVISSHGDTSVLTFEDKETNTIYEVAVSANIAPTIGVQHQTSTEQITHYRYIFIVQTKRSLCCVYFVNSGIPTRFYRIDETNIGSMINNMIAKVYVKSCCWFNEELKIKQMNLENCSPIIFAFLRRTHGCEAGNCKCCCKRKYNEVRQRATSKTVQKTTKSHGKNRWNIRLLTRRTQLNNSLINAALTYKPKMKPLQKKERKGGCYKKICLKLNFNNKVTHAYYLGNNGVISTYIRPNTLCTLQYSKDTIGSWFSSVPTENICCLTEYKKYCLKLTELAHPTTVKFLIDCSNNLPRQCVTCDNVETQNAVAAKQLVLPVILPKYPRHTKPHSKTIKNAFYNLQKGKNVSEKNIDKSTKSSSPKALRSICGESNKKQYTDNKYDKNADANLINLAIGNLRLVILPGGKVKILTKTPLDKISTENLKILREIIQCAQNKVTSHGFNPTRLINVNNLFTNNTPTQKEASSNILWTVLNLTKIEHKRQRNNTLMGNTIDNHSHQVTKGKVVDKELGSNLIKQDNLYQMLTNITAEKRKHYLISHELISTAGINSWEKMLDNEKVIHNLINNIVCNTKERTKRKTLEKGTSPPPKQLRKESLGKTITVVPITSTSNTFLPITPPNVSIETTRQPQSTSFLPNAPLPKIVSTETLQLQVPNASYSLPNNVTVIPIGKLPHEMVMSLYKKYALLPENPHTPNVKAQPLIPINVTEHVLPTTSLLDNSNTMPLMTSVDTRGAPVVLNSQAEDFQNDNTKATDGDCILAD